MVKLGQERTTMVVCFVCINKRPKLIKVLNLDYLRKKKTLIKDCFKSEQWLEMSAIQVIKKGYRWSLEITRKTPAFPPSVSPSTPPSHSQNA